MKTTKHENLMAKNTTQQKKKPKAKRWTKQTCLVSLCRIRLCTARQSRTHTHTRTHTHSFKQAVRTHVKMRRPARVENSNENSANLRSFSLILVRTIWQHGGSNVLKWAGVKVLKKDIFVAYRISVKNLFVATKVYNIHTRRHKGLRTYA